MINNIIDNISILPPFQDINIATLTPSASRSPKVNSGIFPLESFSKSLENIPFSTPYHIHYDYNLSH